MEIDLEQFYHLATGHSPKDVEIILTALAAIKGQSASVNTIAEKTIFNTKKVGAVLSTLRYCGAPVNFFSGKWTLCVSLETIDNAVASMQNQVERISASIERFKHFKELLAK